MRDPRRGVVLIVVLTSLVSNAYFWHARDWNSASRLMLTYAMVDRGTVAINGLEDQTRDRARIGSTYYSDKLPGFSLLAVPAYVVEKMLFGLPDHPLNQPGFTHWPADYGITLGTSGLATALTAGLLVLLSFDLGCGPRRAALVGLAYALGTPAYVYATLSYGHQVTAYALLGAYGLVRGAESRKWASSWTALAGLLAALAAVVEIQVGPVSAVVGLYLIALVAGKRLSRRCLGTFALGALVPTLVLLIYNQLAFGGPLDMGYFHEDIAQFRGVHSAENPLGLRRPDWSRAGPLLWGGYRGLLFYAPILLLAPAGWVVLAVRRRWGTLGGQPRRVRLGVPGQPELSRVDGRLVDRPATAAATAAVRDAAGRRAAGDRLAGRDGRGGLAGDCRRGADAAVPGGRGTGSPGRGRSAT